MMHLETVRRGKASIILAGQQAELLEKLLSDETGREIPGGRGTIQILQLSTGPVVKRHFRHGGVFRALFKDLFIGSSRSFS
jgi:hypothetical protein